MSTPNTKDYQDFHRMLISPWRAQRCIRNLNGVILGIPSKGTPGVLLETSIYVNDLGSNEDKEQDDITQVSTFQIDTLDILSYYCLVILSFTGLCSLLGFTETVDFQEDVKNGLKAKDNNEGLDAKVYEYALKFLAMKSAGQTVKLIRRFEYDFKLSGCRVVMLHYASKDEKLTHLVEIYSFYGKISQSVVKTINFIANSISPVSPLVVLTMYIFGFILQKIRDIIKLIDDMVVERELKNMAQQDKAKVEKVKSKDE